VRSIAFGSTVLVAALPLLAPMLGLGGSGCSGNTATVNGSTGAEGGADDSAAGGGSGSGGSGSGSGDAASTSDGAGGSSSGTVSPPPTNMGDGSVDSFCQTQTASGACVRCCQSTHSAGTTTYYTALRTCACVASVCQTQCATSYCAVNQTNPAAGSTCANCLQSANSAGGSCVSAVSAACKTDPDCVALQMSCIPGCP